MEVYGQRFLIIGMARSGVAAAQLLLRKGALVTVADARVESASEVQVQALREQGAVVFLGEHPLSLLDSCDVLVKNPGIRYDVPIIAEAQRRGIPIVTEIEVGYWFAKAPILGITGSNGKTTTTSLLGAIFAESAIPYVLAGNIGTPLCAAIDAIPEDGYLITELSSFQLLGTQRFRPHIAVFLNIFPAHLDYHGTIAEYIAAKRRLFASQTPEDIAVLSADHLHVAQSAPYTRAQIWWVSMNERVQRGVYVADGTLYVSATTGPDIAILPVQELALQGEHNVENAAAASAAALAAGIPMEALRRGLRTFAGVEHRLEFVREVHGVRYVNDSKATNPEAAVRALRSFPGPVVGIFGGLERNDDLTALLAPMREHVTAAVVLGQSAERMAQALREAGVDTVRQVASIPEAVAMAQSLAHPGDVVLLSPAAASWDMFSSFEERGRIFKEAVHML